MASFHRVIGIDLGTTFSVVAAYNFDKSEVKVIPNRQNEPTTPSVVYIAQDGRVSVGKAAREKLAKDPGRVIFEVKRLMGEKDALGKKAMAKAGNLEIDPEVISAHILRELKTCAEKIIGEPIHDAVITVPARFKEPQKNATREAAKIAKLNPRLIMNEPTAAAVAYGLDTGEPQTFIVFDFGGGTFDVSVVRVMDEKTVEVLGTGGDPHLGGGDIDQKIVDWALTKMKQQFGQDFKNERLIGRLRLKAEQVKINLCNEKQPQEFFLDNPAADIDEINYTLSLADFETMLKPLMERAMKEVDLAMTSAAKGHELSMEDISAFILVGGSSRIPYVKSALIERYKKPIKDDLNPDEIVAMGAARMAQNFDPSMGPEIRDDAELKFDPKAAVAPEQMTDTHIKDVVSHTLGIGLKDDLYDALIPKDHVIPHRVVRRGYTTAEDNQTSVFIPVYQGDNPKGSLNYQLGQVVIDGLAPRPKGAHNFQVTFALDADGVFSGEVLYQQENKVVPIKLDRGQGSMTEKKRIALADQVASGLIGPGGSAPEASIPPPAGSDPIEQVIGEARKLLPSLPGNRQRELSELLTQLEQARAANDSRAIPSLVTQLTMFVLRNKG